MPKVTVKGDKIKHGGNVIKPNQDFVMINGIPINVNGAEISTHSIGKHVHSKKHVKSGQQDYVSINGKKICVKGDKTDCGSNVESGQQDFVSIS